MAAKKPPAKKPATKTEEVELEETDETSEEVTETSTKAKKDEVIFGVADLAALANERFNPTKPYDTRSIRTLIRKMAREENARVEREIIAGNRSRYSWTGPDDPEVVAILKAIGGGEIEQAKTQALADLKEKTAAKKKSKKSKKAAKAKNEPAPADDDEVEIDIDEDDE